MSEIDYGALEKAGYDYRVSCRLCGQVLTTPSSAIIGVCHNCIQDSNNRLQSRILRPSYRTGNGKNGRR